MRMICLFLAVLTLCQCTVPRKRGPDPAALPKAPRLQTEKPPPDTTPPARKTPLPPPPAIPPSQWRGLGFYVLPKQEFVKPFGYELSTCRPGECAGVKAVDASWELDNHRIRCERLSGAFVFADAIEPAGAEWLVTFDHPQSGKKIFAATREGAISELALAADLDSARRRWTGKTVFSRRGVITAFAANSATSLTSVRVDLRDSLFVTDVRWGMTPLPVKPLWLMVRTSAGKTGFIPVRYSWTNTMKSQVTGEIPWEEDLFEVNPATIFTCDDATWDLVNNHRVVLDMTCDQVRLSWGDPRSIGRGDGGQPDAIVWNYPSNRLVFAGGKLISIGESPAPGK